VATGKSVDHIQCITSKDGRRLEGASILALGGNNNASKKSGTADHCHGLVSIKKRALLTIEVFENVCNDITCFKIWNLRHPRFAE
jgi:hypothetical protein